MTERADPESPRDRQFLVTGASRGIGRAISERLLDNGALVVGIGRDFSGWSPLPMRFQALPMDLSDLDRLSERLAGVVRKYPNLSGVICNAGYGRFGALEQFSPPQIRTLVDLNLTQHILVARTFLPRLKRCQRGDLVFMGSEAALAGGRNGAVYCACKFGLRGLAQSLRQECAGSGVRVSIVNPGMVDTDFYRDLRFRPGEAPAQHLRSDDVAAAVLLLLQAPPGTVIDEINLSPLQKVIRFGA